VAQQLLVGQGLLIIETLRSPSDTPHLVEIRWTSDQPDVETWQHITLTRGRLSCAWQDLNPQSQQATGPRLWPCGLWNRPTDIIDCKQIHHQQTVPLPEYKNTPTCSGCCQGVATTCRSAFIFKNWHSVLVMNLFMCISYMEDVQMLKIIDYLL